MRIALTLATMAFALAACGGPKQVMVDHGWVRLPAVAGHPGAAYFELKGGRTDATLVAVSSPQAGRAQMHESMMQNGMSSMAPLDRVAVPAGTTVTFSPGGKHVMLFDLASTVKPGSTISLHFSFADSHAIDVSVPAIAANAPDPRN